MDGSYFSLDNLTNVSLAFDRNLPKACLHNIHAADDLLCGCVGQSTRVDNMKLLHLAKFAII